MARTSRSANSQIEIGLNGLEQLPRKASATYCATELENERIVCRDILEGVRVPEFACCCFVELWLSCILCNGCAGVYQRQGTC